MINKGPKISVIIATYNSSHTLKYTLKSLLNQSFQDFEAWIIGDACTDDTEQVIQEFNEQRFHWYNRTENSGSQPAPNNEGIRRAKGEYIAFLGHDDLWLPHHLEELLKHAEKNKLIFTYSVTRAISPKGFVRIWGKCYHGRDLEHFNVPPSSWFMKKVIVDQIGFWEENYNFLTTGPDSDYFHRIIKLNNGVDPLPMLTVLKFFSTEWKSYKNKEKLVKEIDRIWNKILQNSRQLEIDLLNEISYEYSQYSLNGMIISPILSLKMIKRYYVRWIKMLIYKIPIARGIFHKWLVKRTVAYRQKSNAMRGLS